MASGTGSRRRETVAAFTLVELLLTVALILLLAGAVIFNFGAMGRNARLEEGATQVETLMRFARAQAASTGRRVEIVFGDTNQPGSTALSSTNQSASLVSTNSGVQAWWEPEPIDKPGQFQPLPGASLLVDQINELVRVIATRLPEADVYQTNTNTLESLLLTQLETSGTNQAAGPDGGSAPMSPVICYPDGSSDSVELALSAQEGDDKRIMVVTLSGLTGRLRHRVLSLHGDGTATAADPERYSTNSDAVDAPAP